MVDPLSPLDQPGATIDKFRTSRNPLTMSDEFYDYLRAEGVEDDLALKLARAFERSEQQREFEFARFLDETERWMNLHRHPPVTECLPLVTLDLPGVGNGVSWSPDGGLLFATHAGGDGLTVVDTATHEVQAGWPTLPYTGRGSSVSPDGTKLAIANGTVNFGVDSGFTVIDLATKAVESGWPIATDNGYDVAWSPDGTKLVVVLSYDSSGGSGSPYQRYAVYDIATKTEESGWPNLPSTAWSVDWSPDGSRIAFGVSNGNSGYVVVDVSTKTIESGWPPFWSPATGWEVAWSNDGSSLAIAASGGGDRLAVVTTSTKTLQPGWVSPSSSTAYSVTWSEDDAYLALGWDGGRTVYELAGQIVSTDTWPELPDVPMRHYDVSFFGSHLAVIGRAVTGGDDLYRMTYEPPCNPRG